MTYSLFTYQKPNLNNLTFLHRIAIDPTRLIVRIKVNALQLVAHAVKLDRQQTPHEEIISIYKDDALLEQAVCQQLRVERVF